MKRRNFLRQMALGSAALTCGGLPRGAEPSELKSLPRQAFSLAPALRQDWLRRWQKNVLDSANNRYCDKESGEELGWLVSPFLNGFYYGYLTTRDSKWVAMLCDWMDSCVSRSIKEPDGFRGWPKGDGGGGDSNEYTADSLLGEAMLLRPAVLMSAEIRNSPELKARFAEKSQAYIDLAEEIFRKWDSRDCWRQVTKGGLWIVPQFGMAPHASQWSSGYDQRKTTGFSNPDNKENHIARWLLAMYDVTQKPVYRERAQSWFTLMRSRMRLTQDGKYFVWNYWDPAGPWDYKPDGSPKHWVGVHPNGGYYGIDVEAIVSAFEHGLVFTNSDIERLIATNRDFMWNQQVEGAKFQRIDGGQPDARWKNSPGVLWSSLVPYDPTLLKVFMANHNPSHWGGLSSTPWFLALATA